MVVINVEARLNKDERGDNIESKAKKLTSIDVLMPELPWGIGRVFKYIASMLRVCF